MTAPYRLADGKVVDVETSKEVAELLAAYERQDASERRKGDARRPYTKWKRNMPKIILPFFWFWEWLEDLFY